MGMAVPATHARSCFPDLNWSTCFFLHPGPVSGVGSFASFASSIFLWSDPWQVEQSTPAFDILPSRYCWTTPGVTFLWQSIQALFGVAEKAVLLNRKIHPSIRATLR